MVVAEVGEGRLGAAWTPSAVRAEKDREMRVEAGAGAGCDCGCRCRSRCRLSKSEVKVGVGVGVGIGIGDGVVVAPDWSKARLSFQSASVAWGVTSLSEGE